ncbi:hypothetical protein C8R47DRAFT_1081403 [Mycena vitilis]|nr:hypothetical protein C8R47DRAFT_1081403 [Mycena vitilis]
MADIAMAGRLQPVTRERLTTQEPAGQIRVVPGGWRSLHNSRTNNPRVPSRRRIGGENRPSEARIGDTPPILAKERERVRFGVGRLLALYRPRNVEVDGKQRWSPRVPRERKVRVEVGEAEVEALSWQILWRRRGGHERRRSRGLAGAGVGGTKDEGAEGLLGGCNMGEERKRKLRRHPDIPGYSRRD